VARGPLPRRPPLGVAGTARGGRERERETATGAICGPASARNGAAPRPPCHDESHRRRDLEFGSWAAMMLGMRSSSGEGEGEDGGVRHPGAR
jgi:hypothetical protein